MAFTPGICLCFHTGRAMISDHISPYLPILVCILIQSCLFQSPEEIETHGNGTLGILLIFYGFQQIPGPGNCIYSICQNRKHLAVLTVFLDSGAVLKHTIFPCTIGSDSIPDFFRLFRKSVRLFPSVQK